MTKDEENGLVGSFEFIDKDGDKFSALFFNDLEMVLRIENDESAMAVEMKPQQCANFLIWCQTTLNNFEAIEKEENALTEKGSSE